MNFNILPSIKRAFGARQGLQVSGCWLWGRVCGRRAEREGMQAGEEGQVGGGKRIPRSKGRGRLGGRVVTLSLSVSDM